jgi:hypothetical protein
MLGEHAGCGGSGRDGHGQGGEPGHTGRHSLLESGSAEPVGVEGMTRTSANWVAELTGMSP